MNSIWAETANLPSFNSLNQDISTKILIIGGGLAGILCAYMLQQLGMDYILVEADKICSGITKNTTAKITAHHGLIYNKIIQKYGAEKAKLYYKANQEAKSFYRNICKNIECDFEKRDSYVYSINNKKKILKELEALNKLGIYAKFTNDLPLPFATQGAIKFENEAQFNPLKFVSAISKQLNIYENTPVRELIGTTAVTDQGKITAEKIIVTTHFPFLNKHGSYFLKMYQHRSYVVAIENSSKIKGMYIDEAKGGLSFRNYKDLLLIGGGGHRTGKKGGNFEELESFVKKYYKNSEIKYRWATQDCITLDGLPYIGEYSKSTNNLFVATGFNKWGMTTSMIAAIILSNMVINKENKFSNIFSPSRTILHPQLAANGFEAITNLVKPTSPRCPHMGCALKWNKVEHSWDCPCHGSRFNEKGKIIDNPATDDIK